MFLIMSNAVEFTEKITVHRLSDTFPTFTGGDDAHKAAQFILNLFGDSKRGPRLAGLEQFFVDPMDPKGVRKVWLDVEDILSEQSGLENHNWGRWRIRSDQANCMYDRCSKTDR